MRLHAQDVVLLSGSSVVYRELLLRVPGDNADAAMPEALIRMAEHHGLIGDIDLWVLRRLLQALRESVLDTHSYAVNLSGQSLSNPVFLAQLERLVLESGIDPRRLCFEITETAAVTRLTEAARTLQRLVEQGCRFALDDFGAGVASFAYLKALPLQFLKIDGQLIRGLLNDPRDHALVGALQQIGQAYGLKTIAEHVQDVALLEPLRKLGIDAAQGYVLSEPRPFA